MLEPVCTVLLLRQDLWNRAVQQKNGSLVLWNFWSKYCSACRLTSYCNLEEFQGSGENLSCDLNVTNVYNQSRVSEYPYLFLPNVLSQMAIHQS
jgi:hypothetical protein